MCVCQCECVWEGRGVKDKVITESYNKILYDAMPIVSLAIVYTDKIERGVCQCKCVCVCGVFGGRGVSF